MENNHTMRNICYAAAAIAICIATATGCNKDGRFVGKSGDGNLAFEATVSAQKGNPGCTKAGIISGKGLEIPLSCHIEDGIGGLGANSGRTTKGTLLNTSGETKQLSEYIDNFVVNGWNEDNTAFISGETVNWDSTSGKWIPGTVTAWTGAAEKTFYAWSNLPETGASVTNENSGSFTLGYSAVPTSAEAQTDILLGWYKGNGDSDGDNLTDGIAQVSFSHPLTSVIFKMGEMTGVTGIKSITIHGVYGSGKCTASYTQAAGVVTPSYNWSDLGDAIAVSQEASEALAVDEETRDIGEAFILIPQDLSEAKVKIALTVITNKGELEMSTTIDTGVWAAGKTAVYTLGYTDALTAEPLWFTAKSEQSIRLPHLTTDNPIDEDWGIFEDGKADIDLWYSFDRVEWTKWGDILEPITFGTAEHPTIYLRGDNPAGLGNDINISSVYVEEYHEWKEDILVKMSYFQFGTGADVTVGGNIMSLIDSTCRTDEFPDGVNYAFTGLFAHSPIVDASDLILPASKVTAGSYALMFFFDMSLEYAPELPATEVDDLGYAVMFGATSLAAAPDIPANKVGNRACTRMYFYCEYLAEAPSILPATTLGERCYEGMFADTRITVAPVLPATTLAPGCYLQMFESCDELLQAPDLPATTLAEGCYMQMFDECDELIKAPVIAAKTMAKNACESMFDNCAALVIAPALVAETLAEDCYADMFHYCNNLETVPQFEATTTAKRCCQDMFSECYRLKNFPDLQATELSDSCYFRMFHSCTSLKNAPEIAATKVGAGSCCEMFSNCNSLETFQAELSATDISKSCYQMMFNGCYELATAPALPATTLADFCYQGMFGNCHKLTAAPVLPATTLANNCYNGMFSGCYKLNYIKMLATDITANYCLDYWVSNVASTGTFVKSPDLAIGTGTNQIPLDSYDGIPYGWTPMDDDGE